ncbi:hypothetical protein BpHYR1_033161 [Brachionus plicatilis]|uniref:Uncharacterized protein n=1 Tax=Brachionus plicatilis TaxID=10195 RepID=A0A3M7QLJ2_BRAPC|nr:hypothetical protein BpHYR1_033161 [Brachionus plicatilis]
MYDSFMLKLTVNILPIFINIKEKNFKYLEQTKVVKLFIARDGVRSPDLIFIPIIFYDFFLPKNSRKKKLNGTNFQ